MKKIAIIGAGFRGIGCLKSLLEKGYQVDLFEKNNDVGGVWHPSNNYQGLKIHTPAKINQFLTFPLPPYVDTSTRLESKQVYAYLKSYCDYYQLYLHMQFNTEVVKILYQTAKRKTTLQLKEKEGAVYETKEYDYVINTNGYCGKQIPAFKGAEQFKGSIIHSFDANENLIRQAMAANKKITIIGGGKTATDLVVALRKMDCAFTWLYRKSYWFYRFTPFLNSIKGNEGGTLFKILMLFGFLISYGFPRLSCWLWRLTRVIDTYGERHADFKKFHVSFIDDEEFTILKEANKTFAILGEVDRFAENGYYLKNGKFVEAELVICCTGSSGAKSMVDIEIDRTKLDISKIRKAYRASVIPQVPNLIFTAYHHFAMGLCDGELQAEWIANYMESGLTSEYLDQHAYTYKYPFFSTLILFDSNDYFLPNFTQMQLDFIRNREMKLTEYIRFLYSFFFGKSKLKPLKIYK